MKAQYCYRDKGVTFIIWIAAALLFCPVFLFGMVSAASAETLTWTGSGSWHVAGNWDPAKIPGDDDDVIIPGGSDPVTYSTGTTALSRSSLTRSTDSKLTCSFDPSW